MSTAMELFIIGITVSLGPCFAFCGPVILPYIAATRRGWKEGLKATLIFLFSRLVAYIILGLLAGLLGRLLILWLRQFEYLIFLIGGILILIIGLMIIFGKESHPLLCQFLSRQVVDNNIKGPMLLGLIVGILPCLPILAVLSYIALKSQNLWQGAFYGFSFGMGKFISPLIPLGVLASSLPKVLIKNQRIYNFFNRLCGFILFFIGLNFVISRLLR